MLRTTALVLAIALVLHGGVRAQERYEAASVKRSGAVDRVVPGLFLPNGQWSAQGAPFATLLRSAYGIDRFEGLPRWIANERFDVVTTAAPGTSAAQRQAMARQLLADRFNLRARIEQRISTTTVLVRISPGALGPGLRPSAVDCPRGQPDDPDAAAAARRTVCPEVIASPVPGVHRLQLRDRPLSDLLIISGARSEFEGPIVDRTDLTGRFDIDLEFAPRSTGPRAAGDLGLPYQVAFETQLGLRFERRDERLDVLIIEHVELPSPD